LSSKTPIAYIDLRVCAHATEDPEKVLAAAHSLLPTELIDTVIFKKTSLTGYHGNSITLFETKIKDKNTVHQLFGKLVNSLSILDKELLNSEIQQHIEKGNLYIRLDKQSACLGRIRLHSIDPIHLRIHFKKHKPEEVVEICRSLGLLP